MGGWPIGEFVNAVLFASQTLHTVPFISGFGGCVPPSAIIFPSLYLHREPLSHATERSCAPALAATRPFVCVSIHHNSRVTSIGSRTSSLSGCAQSVLNAWLT